MSLHRVVDDIFSRAYYRIYCFGKDISQKRELSEYKVEKISKNQEEEAKRYYRSYEKIDTCYHDFYYTVTGKFDPRYIPNNLFYKWIDTFYGNKKKTSGLENKCLYEKLFPNMKHPKKYAYRMNGFWYDSENNFRGGAEYTPVFPETSELVVKKANGSCGGKGVTFVSDEKTFLNIINDISGDIIIEYPLKQSLEMSKINLSSVNTIRMMTLLEKDRVYCVSALLRVGVGGSRVDNQCSGGIVCGINNDGSLKSEGFDKNWKKINSHPDTNVEFKNVVIPNYPAIQNQIFECAKIMPFFRLISWDIAIDEENNPVMIEANLMGGGINLHQVCNGPLFGDRTEIVLKEVFKPQNKKSIYKKM